MAVQAHRAPSQALGGHDGGRLGGRLGDHFASWDGGPSECRFEPQGCAAACFRAAWLLCLFFVFFVRAVPSAARGAPQHRREVYLQLFRGPGVWCIAK